jgi:hypothetical protein
LQDTVASLSGPERAARLVAVEIRSYRAVFDLERRIYRVDRLRLNPGGVPLRGVVYCLALLAGLVLLATLPLLGAAVRALPWYLRDLVLPAGLAALLTMIRVEGRPFHLAAAALLRYALGPRCLAGLRPTRPVQVWRPGELLLLPDGSDARLRRLRYTGPGAVLVRVAHERSGAPAVRSPRLRAGLLARLAGRPHVVLREPAPERLSAHPRAAAGRPTGGLSRGQVIALERGVRLEVRRALRHGG